MGWVEDLDTEATVSRVRGCPVDSRMIVVSTEEDVEATEEETEAGSLAGQSNIRDRISTSEMATSRTRTEIGRTGQFRVNLSDQLVVLFNLTKNG